MVVVFVCWDRRETFVQHCYWWVL